MFVNASTDFGKTLNRHRRYRLHGSNHRHKWKILKMQDREARRMGARDARVMEQVRQEQALLEGKIARLRELRVRNS